MLSYAKGPDVPLLECTIDEALRKTVASHPDRTAVVVRHQNIRLTWREFEQQVAAVSRALHAMDLTPGDRVGVWATNCIEWLLLQYACARNGLVQVNVNPAYRAHELQYVIAKSRMEAIFLNAEDRRTNFAAILHETGSTIPAIYFGSASWTAFLSRQIERTVETRNTDIVNIQYTSGTTGSPKGVLLSHRNLLNNGYLVGRSLRLTHQDSICIPVPLYHCFGCVMGSLAGVLTGAALVFPAPSFDPLATLEAIHNERATAIYGVPTMFIAQLDHPEFPRFDLTSLRTGIMAGAPCPVEVMKQVVDRMHCREMTIAYGQTESSPVITGSQYDDPLELRVSTVGGALPCTEVKIIDPETGATVPAGVQGELCTRGYLVMTGGYDGEPEATARAIDPEGWLHTGDLARMREDGYFRITGRARDLIIRGGENIYPREIEEFLYTHPKISDVQIIGLPDARLGEIVAAWVLLKPGVTCTEDEIRDFCKDRIAHFKIPQCIRFVDAFPMTVTGKIQKFRMREIDVEERGLQSAASIQTA